MKVFVKPSLFIMFTCLVGTFAIQAQSPQRPFIWITQDERDELLETIENEPWAAAYLSQLKSRVDADVNKHQISPLLTMGSFPEFATDPNQYNDRDATTPASQHKNVLAPVADAAMLYFITEEEKYAQYAADKLEVYFDHLAQLTPETTTICGNDFYDPRTTYPHIAIAYDFIYNFLTDPSTTVYDRELGTRIPFDNVKAQKALTNIVGNALQEWRSDNYGRTVSNHPILTAPGALFPILCIEDDTERERLLNVFWEKGTWHQASFTKTILPMFTEQGLWPEPVSYSFMPNVSLVLNVIDRIKPEWNVAAEHGSIFEGIFLFDYLRYPDRRFVRYGDSKRNNDSTEALFRFAHNIAERRGLTDLQVQAEVALKQAIDAEGGRPSIGGGTFDNYHALKLIWGVDLPDAVEGEFDFTKPTVLVTHAGVALQRNAVDENNVDYGLTGIIGGAHYVHSHVTGISMELYGAGYVMAPNAGLANTLAERQDPENKSYFRLHAGNNCVIVNGTSHGRQQGSWASNSYVWQDTAVNEAAEPQHLEDPVSPNTSFATQYLNDTVNQADQQRTLAIIRTSPTTGYYFDLFRSRSRSANNFHDYIYHNIGDETIISDSTGVLGLTPTNRYDNDIGDPVGSPGWRFFENEQVTPETAEPVKVQFRVNFDNRSMNLFVPDGVAREYTHALAPATREAKNGYVSKKTQVLAIRQQGEAWDRPFIAILEPSTTFDTSVQSVTQLTHDERVVGAKVVSEVNGKTVTNYIICQEGPDAYFEDKDLGLSFTGRFGVVTDRGGDDVELYIGEGSFLTYGSHLLSSTSGEATAAATHRQDNGALAISAHDPVHVGSGDGAQLFAGLHEDKVVLTWPGFGLKLQQQGNDWPDGNWVDVADTDQRPVYQAVGDSQRMFFRLVED
jgi:hypothetical protein